MSEQPQQPEQAPPPYGAPPPGYGYPPPPPGQAGYGYPPGYGYPQTRGTNVLAIIALVSVFVFTPAALVFGLIARSQIKQSGEAGDGMALAGVILGALSIVFVVVVIVGFAAVGFGVSSGSSGVVQIRPVPGLG